MIPLQAHAQTVTVSVGATVTSVGTVTETVQDEPSEEPVRENGNECMHSYDEATNTYMVDC